MTTAGNAAAAGHQVAVEPGGPAAGFPGMPLAIEVRGLRKRYGTLVVLDGLDLSVPQGEIVALLGPNGAGKTTTVEILEGYRGSDGGEIRVLGLDPVRDRAALHARVGLMLQQGGITPQGRPRELVRLHARFYADPAIPTSSWTSWVWRTRRTGATSSSRAVRSSDSRWRSRWSGAPSSWSSTSRPPAWILPRRRRCVRSSQSSGRPAARFS